MTRNRLVCALILVFPLSACGGEPAAAALNGLWGIERADGCVVLFRYDEDGDCAFGIACNLNNGALGVQRHEGSCELQGGQLTARWDRSSCADTEPVYRAEAEVDGDRLILSGDAGRLVFERVEEDGASGNGIAVYGCWADGTLEPRELMPL